MKVLILGAAGMVGRKLLESMSRDGKLGDKPVSEVLLSDVVLPQVPAGLPFACSASQDDLPVPGTVERLVGARPDVIVHLAAIVSGEAEADFEKGYRINLEGTQRLFEAIRQAHGDARPGEGYYPRVIFSSSIAVFGAPFPERIGDEFFNTPLTSYGTQKAIGELLLADYSRRGFFDGIGIRLPTIAVRPGKPNKAASGFFSGILREPLNGQEAILPVADDVRHWFASPRSAVGFLHHSAAIDTARLGARRNLSMPGLSATVAEEIEALRRAAGDKAVALIKRQPDPVIEKIVAGWPRDFDTARALELGFVADRDMDAIVQAHIEDELGGKLPAL
ncbi:SDR family oxidoreductase [Labrys sp. KNU-23]|uniref:D-erythronate dehydrogenase n=1 Tax=Labrys sp. KNU-23 TaxID=2789216 RepID=UPI0011EC311C|nr:D-erythronate dehydrogenase [Labrys sp. KNU-23]QEN87854.1 SDR family oxidoreductase [Labrys sp. KNU-23]